MKNITKILLVVAPYLANGHTRQTRHNLTQGEVATSAPTTEQEHRISWQTSLTLSFHQAIIPVNQAQIVLCPPGPNLENVPPAHVFFNRRFHSAVPPGAYAEALGYSSEQKIELKSRTTVAIDPDHTLCFKVQIKSHQTAYVGLGAPLTSEAVGSTVANAQPRELPLSQRQNHSASRMSAFNNYRPQETRYNLASSFCSSSANQMCTTF